MARIKQACTGTVGTSEPPGCCLCEQSCFCDEIGFRVCVGQQRGKCYDYVNDAKWVGNYDDDYMGSAHFRGYKLGAYWENNMPTSISSQAAPGESIHYLIFTIFNADVPTGVNCSTAATASATQPNPLDGTTHAKCPSIIARNFITRVTNPLLATRCPWAGALPAYPARGIRIRRVLDTPNLHAWGGDCDPHKLPNVMLLVVAHNNRGGMPATNYEPANDRILAQCVKCVAQNECVTTGATDGQPVQCCLDPDIFALYPTSITISWDGSNAGSMTLLIRDVSDTTNCKIFTYSSWSGFGIPPACTATLTWSGKDRCDETGETTGSWDLTVNSYDAIAESYTTVGTGEMDLTGDKRYPYGTCTITLDIYNPEGCFGGEEETVTFTVEP